MISTVLALLFSYSYSLGTILGRPDTIKLLVSPQRVVERGDTVVVLDEDWPGHLSLKRYNSDGFFVRAEPYLADRDSGLFGVPWLVPDSATVALAMTRKPYEVHGLYDRTWGYMAVAPDSTIWLVEQVGDADFFGTWVFGFSRRDSTWRVGGFGPYYSDFKYYTLRGNSKKVSYLYAGQRYLYLVSDELLYQYDREVRLVRKIGTSANGCFKEPSSIAVDNRGVIYVSDFRLGKVWMWDPRAGRGLRDMPIKPDLLEDSPSSMACDEEGGVWVSDLASGAVRRISWWSAPRSFSLPELGQGEGMAVFQIAVADSWLCVLENRTPDPGSRILVYDTLGRFHGPQLPRNSASKVADTRGMDNAANGYFVGRAEPGARARFYRMSADGADLTKLVMPDSTPGYELDWSKAYRVAETLYVLGAGGGYHTKSRGCFFVFVNDAFDHALDGAEFEGGLAGWYKDFAVDPSGNIWVVDIVNRVVQEYRRGR